MECNTMIDAYKGRNGFMAYCTLDGNGTFNQYWTNNTNDLYKYKSQFGETVNNYLAMAMYDAKRRSKIHAKEMSFLYVDIDCELKPLTLSESKALATAILENDKLPDPYLIEFSGHGLQIFYCLKNAYDIGMWEVYQTAIVNAFRDVLDEIQQHTLTELSNILELNGIHIDDLKDPSRVMRIPDTANIKDKNNIVKAQEIYKSNTVYTLETLKKYDVFKVLPKCTPYNALNVTDKELKEIKKDVTNNVKGVNLKLKYYLETIIATRIEDLQTLIQVRNKNGITEGYRNNLVFIYTATLSSLGYSKQDAKEEIELLNDMFTCPLSKKELHNCLNTCYEKKMRQCKDGTRTLERTYYKFKTKKIMEMLDITEEEQNELKILIGKKVRNRRDWKKNGEKYNAKRRKKYATATEQDKAQKNQRNKEILELKKQGYTNKQLMDKYGLSKRTIQYIVNSH